MSIYKLKKMYYKRERVPRVYENRMPRGKFGPKRLKKIASRVYKHVLRLVVYISNN
jgi:hypothetical protein